MARASDNDKNRARDDKLKIIYTVRIASPGEPGSEKIHARQIRAMASLIRRVAIAHMAKEGQEESGPKR